MIRTDSARWRRPMHRLLLLVCLALLLPARGVLAQEALPDTLGTRDTLDVPVPPDEPSTTDTVVTRPPPLILISRDSLHYASPDSAPVAGGIGVTSRFWHGVDRPLVLPVVTIAPDAAHLLAEVPGSFLYDLGASGWPQGWSPDGIDPASVGLRALGVSWNDPITGRPRLDMLPIEFMQPLELQTDVLGRAAAVDARLRSYDVPRPATELRYRKGAAGLQSIAATHAQRRLIRPFGREGLFLILIGYGGRAADGEYPGSRLRRERRVLGRLSFKSGDLHVSVVNLHGRRQIGAHGGVTPRTGGGIESVYERFGARVTNERATRRSIRNDLIAEVRLPFRVAGSPPVVRASWTSDIFRYRDSGDTLVAETDRLGAQIEHSLRMGAFSPDLHLEIAKQTSVLSWMAERPSHTALHASASDTLEMGPAVLHASAGIHREHATSPSAALGLQLGRGSIRLVGSASHGRVPDGLVYSHGFGELVQPEGQQPDARLSILRGGVVFTHRALELSLAAFFNQTQSPALLSVIDGDTLAVARIGGSTSRVGLTATLGLRAAASRGFYLSAEATLSQDASDADAPALIADVVPEVYGKSRAGLRYRLFRGDLDLHAFVEARAWSEFQSRSFHAPTGLLILPEGGGFRPGPSSTLGLFLEAGVREATIFVAWENILAGTQLMHGTMLVPIYPLPEQAFRFGVYWPILD